MAKKLTKEALMALAKSFRQAQSKARHRELFGVTDGKAVEPPTQGYLTVSNALQWRLQYGRIAALESSVPGIEKIP